MLVFCIYLVFNLKYKLKVHSMSEIELKTYFSGMIHCSLETARTCMLFMKAMHHS